MSTTGVVRIAVAVSTNRNGPGMSLDKPASKDAPRHLESQAQGHDVYSAFMENKGRNHVEKVNKDRETEDKKRLPHANDQTKPGGTTSKTKVISRPLQRVDQPHQQTMPATNASNRHEAAEQAKDASQQGKQKPNRCLKFLEGCCQCIGKCFEASTCCLIGCFLLNADD